MSLSCSICLEFQATQLKEKPYDITWKQWETVGAKTYFCIVDYRRKFRVGKLMDGLSAPSLIRTCKIIFTEYRLLRKIKSDAGTNFVSEKV